MFRRSSFSVIASVLAFLLGGLVSNRPATVNAQIEAGRGKCVGIATRADSVLVYRVFEDGTVEAVKDRPDIRTSQKRDEGTWTKVGQ